MGWRCDYLDAPPSNRAVPIVPTSVLPNLLEKIPELRSVDRKIILDFVV